MQKFWTIRTFDPSCVPNFAVVAYEKVLPYVENFLNAPHPFREGTVCPFVPSALKGDRIFFTSCSEDDTSQGHANHIERCVEFYLSSKTNNRSFGALIILFPEEYDIGKLLELHLQNKEQCVRHSLMLGALYRTNQGHSLYSEEYYPLRTPTPVLVIRDMVAVSSDLALLDQKHYSIVKRMAFLEIFIQTFQNHKAPGVERLVWEASQSYWRYKKRQRFLSRMKVGTLILVLMLIILSCSLAFRS